MCAHHADTSINLRQLPAGSCTDNMKVNNAKEMQSTNTDASSTPATRINLSLSLKLSGKVGVH
jgi:hypothetical protein